LIHYVFETLRNEEHYASIKNKRGETPAATLSLKTKTSFLKGPHQANNFSTLNSLMVHSKLLDSLCIWNIKASRII